MTSEFQAGVPATISSRLREVFPCGGQLCEGVLAHIVEIGVAAGQADFNAGHRSDKPVANDLRGFMKHGNGALP